MLVYAILVLQLLLSEGVLGYQLLPLFWSLLWIIDGLVLQVPELWNLDVHHDKVLELGQIGPVDGTSLHLREVLNLTSVSRYLVREVIQHLGLVSLELALNHLAIPFVVCETSFFEFFSCISPRWRLLLDHPGCRHLHVGLQVAADLVDDLANLDELAKGRKDDTSHEAIETCIMCLTTF